MKIEVTEAAQAKYRFSLNKCESFVASANPFHLCVLSNVTVFLFLAFNK